MAFTKVTAAGIGSTGTVTLQNVIVTGGINAPIITGAASTANVRTNSIVVSGISTLTTLRATNITGVSTAGITTAYIGSVNDGPISGARNRIINGDMRIDQRNEGGSVTPAQFGAYCLDRWLGTNNVGGKFSVQQNAGSVTPPVGFSNYLGATSTSNYSIGSLEFFALCQNIEGFNIADLGWGTGAAATVTLSFWVRSSLTGTFGGSLQNNDGDRSYPYRFTISSANTWEYKTVTVLGDTTGTWLTTNGRGIRVFFSLGAGSSFKGTSGVWSASNLTAPTGSVDLVATNGATFYITGVQLEAGTVATPFERRSFGQELALCQRYFFKNLPLSVAPSKGQSGMLCPAVSGSFSGNRYYNYQFPVVMRTTPTIAFFNSDAAAPDNTLKVYWDIGFTGQPQANLTPTLDINNGYGIAGYVQPGGTGTAIIIGSITANAEL